MGDSLDANVPYILKPLVDDLFVEVDVCVQSGVEYRG